jgi:DNA-binding NarL/FixJ family response regulator
MLNLLSIAIVEDESDLRDGFSFLISRAEGMRVCGACGSAEEALAALPPLRPEVVLMDIQLPGSNGIDCILALKEKLPETRFLVLTVFENDDVVFGALEAGASGYLLKTSPPEKLLAAIRELRDGGAPMSPQIARRVVERFRPPVGPAQAKLPVPELTDRESEVLALLARGHLYKEIADQLSISVETIRKHLGRIYKKLHVKSRTEAVVRYLTR